MTIDCDLLVVGSGPAGMSAAINGASEGLNVCMIDANTWLGGQARESNAIENYPGFPDGITGDELMSRFTAQAAKFNTRVFCPVRASSLHKDGERCIITADDYTEYAAKCVLLSVGLSYRRLDADNLGRYVGKGVYYGLPVGSFIARKKCNITVVGGANSAGQAVLKLAENKNAKIRMVIRKQIQDQMSTYLIDRIRKMDNVDVVEGHSVVGCRGDSDRISHITFDNGEEHCTDGLYIFIGATPRTHWLQGAIQLDDRKFIPTWDDIQGEYHQQDGTRMPYETSMLGVFAAGDVRVGSVKRIVAAIGEGGTALQMIHNRLTAL